MSGSNHRPLVQISGTQPWNLYPDPHKSQAHQVTDYSFFPTLAILSTAQGRVRQLPGNITSSPLLYIADSIQRQNTCLWQRVPAEPGLIPTLLPTSPCSTPSNDEALWYLTGSHHQLGEAHRPSAFLYLTLLQLSQHVCPCCPSRIPQIALLCQLCSYSASFIPLSSVHYVLLT